MNSWGLAFYCLPEQNNSGILVPFDIKIISQKCGLKGKAIEDEINDEAMLIKKILEHGGPLMKIDIKKMYGSINNYETHGNQSPIVIYGSDSDVELMQAISELKDKITLMEDDYEDLKTLLEELENSKEGNRISIKNRINNWMSQFANMITIGSVLYDNRQMIYNGVQHILNLL